VNVTAAGFEPGPPQPVAKQRVGNRWTLRFTQIFPHRDDAVWSALTQPDELSSWAPYTADRNLGQVGPATLIMNDGLRPAELDGEVTVATRPRLLEHAWGGDRLRWELTSVDGGTELTLLHTLDAEMDLPMMAAGWHLCLLVAERFLDGTPIEPIVGQKAMDYGFESLRDTYAAIINPHIPPPAEPAGPDPRSA
jgi:uncharacterized protein YndB with AHSA1/START domain